MFVACDSIIERRNKILLVKRKFEPFKGFYAFPGGKVEENELVEKAIVREVKEETGYIIKPIEILGVYSDPKRDPRGHVITITFISKIIKGKLKNSIETEPKWFKINEVKKMKLAFDHSKIFKDYLKWKKKKQTFWSTK